VVILNIISIIIAIILFSIIVIFHELGHFWLAKANGIKVNEFCLGLGPTLFGVQRGETKYSIKMLPFGGACIMEGEDESSGDDRAFNNKSVWARISVVFAGPFFNFIMAFLFALIIICSVGYDSPKLAGVIEGYAAESVLLRVEKLISMRGEQACEIEKEMALIYLHHAIEKAAAAGRSAITSFAEGDEQRLMLMGLKRFTKVEPYNLKNARRKVAKHIIEKGEYPF